LLLSGVTQDGLPSGDYWFTIEIEDLPAVANRYKLYMADDVETTVPIQVSTDPRQLVFSTQTMDSDIARIISESIIGNNWSLTDWLKDPRPRTSRKACVLNLLAKLRCAPTPDNSLIKYVQRLFFVGTERVYAKVAPALLEELQSLSRDPKKPFYSEGSP